MELLQRLMLLVVIATTLRAAAKEDVMGIEDNEDEELADKRDEDYEDYYERKSGRKLDVEVVRVKRGRNFLSATSFRDA